MFRFAEIRKVLLGALAVVGVVAAGLVAALVALSLALAGIAGLLVHGALRRIAGKGRPPKPGDTRVIEGEYRVEREDRLR